LTPSNLETNLALISELINEYKKMKNYNILSGGDFNADFGRSKRFDRCLAELVKRDKIKIVKIL
jgi:hypothetical protein